MFTQFKNYVEQAKLPIYVSIGTGILSGMVAGITSLSAIDLGDPVLNSCAPGDATTILHAQIIGGAVGLATGLAIGAAFPTAHMFFDWYSGRRSGMMNNLQEINNPVEDVELGVFRI